LPSGTVGKQESTNLMPNKPGPRVTSGSTLHRRACVQNHSPRISNLTQLGYAEHPSTLAASRVRGRILIIVGFPAVLFVSLHASDQCNAPPIPLAAQMCYQLIILFFTCVAIIMYVFCWHGSVLPKWLIFQATHRSNLRLRVPNYLCRFYSRILRAVAAVRPGVS